MRVRGLGLCGEEEDEGGKKEGEGEGSRVEGWVEGCGVGKGR